ncbi:MAG: hypothetical protein WA952_08575 [Lewinella sp.]
MSAPLNVKYLDCLEACQRCLIDCKVCLAKMAGKESMTAEGSSEANSDCPWCCIQCIEVLEASIGLMAADSKFAAE